MGWPARACIGGVVRTTGVERGGDVHEIRDSLDQLRRGKVRDASGRLAGLSEELQPRKLKGLAPAEAAVGSADNRIPRIGSRLREGVASPRG